MSESEPDIDRTELRRTIRTLVTDRDTISRRTLLDDAAIEAGVPSEAVRREVNALERKGFVYMVGEDDPEVRLP